MDRKNKSEWLEILQPLTNEKMYANLSTGECTWELPSDVTVKQGNNNQWWQLFDSRTSQFYYYNVALQQSSWLPPADDMEILQLAILQGFKDVNSEAALKTAVAVARKQSEMKDSSTQTSPADKSQARRRRNVRDRHVCKTPLCKVRTEDTNGVDVVESSMLLKSQPNSSSSDAPDVVRDATGLTESPPVDADVGSHHENDSSCDTELGVQLSSSQVSDVSDLSPPSEMSHASEVDTKATNYTVSDVPPPIVMSDDTEPDTKLSSCSEGNVLTAEVKSDDMKAASKSSSCPISKESVVVCDIAAGFKPSNGHVGEVSAADVKSDDTEVGTQVSGCSLSESPVSAVVDGAPAAAVISYDAEADSKSISDTVSDLSSSSLTSRDREAGTKATTAEASSALAVAVTSHDTEAGTKSTPTGHPSPGRYLRKSTTGSPLTNRRSLTRTNVAYAAHTSSVDSMGSQKLSEVSLSSSTDTGLSVGSTSQDQDLSRKQSNNFSVGAELPSLSRHLRCSSEPHIVAMQGSDAVSVDIAATDEETTEPSRESKATSTSSKLPKYNVGSASAPSTPLRLRRTATASAADDGSVDPSIYRRKPRSSLGKFQQVFRRGGFRPYTDEVDGSSKPAVAKRQSAPVFDEWTFERYIAENLNEHRQGIFRLGVVSIDTVLSWTKDTISRPMLRTTNKVVKKEAIDVFKQIQIYMGDRMARTSPTQAALEVVSCGWTIKDLRDEIFVQLCRQTTNNPNPASLQRGWELFGICLSFFPPSSRFSDFLEGYFSRHVSSDDAVLSRFAARCQKRLDCITRSGPKRGLKQPTLDEITQSLYSMFHPSMFGATLNEVMQMQAERYPGQQLPWIQTALSEEILRLNGPQTEGIFRVPGDLDEVNSMKVSCDQWKLPVAASTDPHLPASLLKLWFRELSEPMIPLELYSTAVTRCHDADACVALVNELPELNRLVLLYLVHFLQVFALPGNVAVTKMDVSNIAMVWAPNCLRGNYESDDTSVVLENTRNEMSFLRTLFQSLDTSYVDTVLASCPCCEWVKKASEPSGPLFQQDSLREPDLLF